MITIYPMLYTSGVSESALPGICTVLEAYLLTYHQQEILTNPSLVNNPNRRVNFKVDSRGRITGRVRESYVLEADPNDPNDPDVYNAGNKPDSPKIITPRTRSQFEDETLQKVADMEQEIRDRQNELSRREEEIERREEERQRKEYQDDIDYKLGKLDLQTRQNKVKDEINIMNKNAAEIEKIRLDRQKIELDLKKLNNELDDVPREKYREDIKDLRDNIKSQIEVNKNKREDDLHGIRKRKDAADASMKELELKEKQKELIEDKMKKASVKIESISSKTISLEPSTVMVALEMPNKVTKRELLGVKVVPMKVQSDVKMAYLLTSDAQLSFIMRLVTVAGRGILKKAWSIFDKMLKAISIGPFKEYGGVTVTGDPRKDIILGRTGHQGETFITIEKSTDFDEFILADPVKIKKLFQLGWGNLIITDNVTKQAHFCMKKYRGICNTIPYVMLYESLKMSKSYETLEDIKKQTQSLFKAKPIRIEKVLSEILAVSKLSQYKSLREGK